MDVVWNTLALPSLLALAVAWTMAGFVLAAAPWNPVNRRLAAMLALDGIAFGAASGFQPVFADMPSAFAARAVSVVATLSLFWVYLLFLSTLDSPLTRPLRPRAVQWALAGLAVASPLLWFAASERFVPRMVEGVPGMRWFASAGPWLYILYYAMLAVSVYALLACFTAWRRAPVGSPARTRARGAALAFGVRDATNGFVLAAVLLFGVPGYNAFLIVLQGFVVVAFVMTLAYSILETQVFDLDLRVRSGVRRTVVVGAFILVAFAIGQIIQTIVAEQVGSLTGLLVAIVLAFALRPVEGLADKAANLVVPASASSHDRLAQRKSAIYSAAIESALEEGGISDKEAAILRRLREKLGLDEADASLLEAHARARFGGISPSDASPT